MAVSPYRCCDRMDRKTIGDCGEITGFDLTLQRCRICGAYLIDLHWAGSNTCNVLPPGIARYCEIVREGIAESLKEAEGLLPKGTR